MDLKSYRLSDPMGNFPRLFPNLLNFIPYLKKTFLQLVPVYDEQRLLQQLAKGDEQAFTQLFYAYKDKLFSFVYNLTVSQSKAEDILQDVFLKIWQRKEQMAAVENLNAYLFRMCKNTAIDHLRRLSEQTLSLSALLMADTPTPASGSPEELLFRKEMRQRLKTAVDQLPQQQKTVFLLIKEKGMKHEEVAHTLNLSLSTIQNHLFRAIQNIRQAMGAEYGQLFLYLVSFSELLFF